MRWIYALVTLISLAAMPAMAETMPGLAAESLAGDKITFPDALAGKGALLIIGFSHTSRDHVTRWSEQLRGRCAARNDLACYDVTVIAGVPSLLRGFVAERIRDNIPKKRHDRFLLVRDQEQVWKSAAGFSEQSSDDAYLLLLNRDGKVQWRSHGPWSDALQTKLLQQPLMVPRP